MVFVGLEVITKGPGNKHPKICHINSKYIKYVNEDEMNVVLDDNTTWRISSESLDVFLSAIYGKED